MSLSKRPKGKGKATTSHDEVCSCCGTSTDHRFDASLPVPPSTTNTGSKCGHPPLSNAQHRRLTAVLASLFQYTYLSSLKRCHGILIGVTYESIAYGFIKRALTQDDWTPAQLRCWLDDENSVKAFKEHARDALKAAYKDLANMVLGSTLDGVYERLADLIEATPEENPPASPIACSCALFQHVVTLDDFVASLQEHEEETAARFTAPVGPLKTWVLEQHAEGKLQTATEGELSEQPGWQGWSKRALPATLKRMERVFGEALIEYKLGEPLRAPKAAEYLDALRDVDGLRLYTLSALRYELALAAKAPLADKSKGKGKAKADAPSTSTSVTTTSTTSTTAPGLEAAVALRLSAKGASSEALWSQLGTTVSGLVNSLAPPSLAHPPVSTTTNGTKAKGKSVAAIAIPPPSATTATDAISSLKYARAAYEQTDFEMALQYSTEAVHYDPTDATNYLHRARVLLRLNRPAEAEVDCTKALDIEPGNFKALLRRGLARRAIGGEEMEELAIEDFERALAMQPEDEEARIELAKLKQVLSRLASGKSLV